jgi:integrase
MANVNFEYRSKKTPANLNLRFTHKVKDEFISIRAQIDDPKSRCNIEKSFWQDCKAGRNFRDTDKANRKTELEAELKSLEKHVLSAYEEAKEINRDWLKGAIKSYYNPPKEEIIPTTLLANWKKHVSIKNMVINFIEYLNKERSDQIKDIEIKQVDDEFAHLWTEYGINQDYEASTIKKGFNIIKTVLKHAKHHNGIELNRAFDVLKIDLESEELPKIWLTFEELKKIEAVAGLNENQETARDWLIISCYTGQRVSDFMRFDDSMVKKRGKVEFIEFKQVKTGKQMAVPVLPEVKAILDKRGGKFPKRLTAQKYNNFVKEVCLRAGITNKMKGKITKVLPDGKIRGVIGTYKKHELITSHVGRRSFATNYYGRVPTAYIKTVTGHATEAMLLKYIGKADPGAEQDIYKAFTALK